MIYKRLVVKVASNVELRVTILRLRLTRKVASPFAHMWFTAALLVIIELTLVHLGDTFNFLHRDRAFTQWTACIYHKPLLDAGSMEVMPDITGKGCHERIFIKID